METAAGPVKKLIESLARLPSIGKKSASRLAYHILRLPVSEALALSGGMLGALGAGIGALVKSDVWIPVALDALGPPPAQVGRVEPVVRAAPGRLSLGLSVRF